MESCGISVLLSAFVFIVSSRLLLAASPLLGVSPQDEKYFAGSVIACKDVSRSFARDRLNDGFCDCPDGTDEPGTSACPESKFYCRNTGDTPQYLFSSRVNDYICDCCDGSDEYASGTYCPNTCSSFQIASEDKSDKFNVTTVSFSNVDSREKRTRDELEDLIDQLKGLKVVMILMFMIAFCMFYRRMKCRSRRHQLKQ